MASTYHQRGFVVALLLLASRMLVYAAPPGEVTGVAWAPGSKTTLTWSATPGAAGYVVYRGDGSSLSRLADSSVDSCLVGVYGSTTTGALLRDDPPPSSNLEWYLVAARNADGEGTAGDSSSGPRQLGAWGRCCNQLTYAESFDGSNGSVWPQPWFTMADSVAVADLQSGRARFKPRLSLVGYSLGRMGAGLGVTGDAAAQGERDVEATYTIEFENAGSQGIGFYVRQNGGYCTSDNTAHCGPSPAGSGFALFFHGPYVGGVTGFDFWYELNGDENMIAGTTTAFPISNNIRYRVRFRCVQWTATETRLSAKVWQEGDQEPAAWNAETTIGLPALQNAFGGIGVDSFVLQSGACAESPASFTFLDDIEVRRVCNPLIGAGALAQVSAGYSSANGPLWLGDRLLFTDFQADAIYQLIPPSDISVYRLPSNRANGLAVDVNGDLLAAEQTTHRISRTDSTGAISTVASEFLGVRLNAPNDLVVRADGTIYFADPDYDAVGMTQLNHNSIYRVTPGGAIFEFWQGNDIADQPNGIALSPDEKVLYVTNSSQGRVDRFLLAADGSAALQSTFASGLSFPDGLCVDAAGNLWVATQDAEAGQRLQVFAPDGTRWGTISILFPATKCAFGDADLRTLYLSAGSVLYRMAVPIPGMP